MQICAFMKCLYCSRKKITDITVMIFFFSFFQERSKMLINGLPVSPRKSVMSRVSSSRAVTRLSVQVLVFSMLILMLSSLLSRGWLFAVGLLPAWQLLLPTCCWPSWWWGERTDSVLLVCKLTPVVALPFTSRRLGARRPPPPPPPPPTPVTERPPPPSPSLQQIGRSTSVRILSQSISCKGQIVL